MKSARKNARRSTRKSTGKSAKINDEGNEKMDSMINVRNMIRFLGITIALMLITLGIWTGGYQDILNKATHICLECIGIG